MAEGLLALAGVTAGLAAVVGLMLHAPSLVRGACRAARRLGLGSPPPEPPARFPVERLAADLVRIRSDLDHADPRMPVARRRGIVAAYDDTLVDACDALAIPTTLADLPLGFDHDVERLRVETELESAGLLPRRWPRSA